MGEREEGHAAGLAAELTANGSRVDADTFAVTIGAASDRDLEQVMASESRRPVLDEIFNRMAEHVEPDRIRGTNAVVHFKILDRPDGGYDHYEVILDDGRCEASVEPKSEANVTIRIGPVPFLRLVSGHASGPVLFMTGKLKLEGDVMLASRLTSFFRIPQS